MKKGLIALAALVAAAQAHAEVIATCGASDGHGYYIPSGLMPNKDAGWQAEAISGGSFKLIRSAGDLDIAFIDAINRNTTARAEGGRVSALETEDSIVVQVIYGGSIETYVFWLSLDKPIATFSQAKFDTLFQKHSVMRAPCRKGG